MLKVDHLSLFLDPTRSRSVFSDVSFAAVPGSVIGVEGASGSGKTALLLSLAGLLESWFPTSILDGDIEIFGRRAPAGATGGDYAIVTENPYSQTTGLKTLAIEEIAVPLEMRGVPREIMKPRCQDVAWSAGLSERLHGDVQTLSGGELVRVHIAAALTAEPRLILLDQVFSELDPEFQYQSVELVRTHVSDREGVALFSYSPGEVPAEWFDSVVSLSQVESAAPDVPSAVGATGFGRSEHSKQEPTVRATAISFRYPSTDWLFRDLSFSLYRGQAMVVLGRNGSGKTTLFRVVAGLLSPVQGTIEVVGRRQGYSTENHHHDHGLRLAFQNPDISFCASTVGKELQMVSGQGLVGTSAAAELLGLTPHLGARVFDLPRSLRKRVSVAVAAGSATSVVLLDEPSQYQDSAGVVALMSLFDLLLESGCSIMCTSHDRRLIAALRSRGAAELHL